jgi:hypothetical protein
MTNDMLQSKTIHRAADQKLGALRKDAEDKRVSLATLREKVKVLKAQLAAKEDVLRGVLCAYGSRPM